MGWAAYALVPSEESEEPEQNALGSLAEEQGQPQLPATALATAPSPDKPPPSQQRAQPVGEASDDLGEDDLGEDDLGEDDLGEDDLGEDDLGDVEGAAADDESEGSADTDEGAQDGYWIQAASLRLKEKADRLAQKLSDKGYNAQSMAYGGPRAGWWHVVRIGPYVTRMEAEKARLAFVRAERMNTAVLPRAHGPYYVQIASLRSQGGANKEARRLQRLGHNAVVGTIKTKSRGTWFTLRVGPFDFESDAYGYQKLLEADGVQGDITPRPKTPPPVEVVSVEEQPGDEPTAEAFDSKEAPAAEPPEAEFDQSEETF